CRSPDVGCGTETDVGFGTEADVGFGTETDVGFGTESVLVFTGAKPPAAGGSSRPNGGAPADREGATGSNCLISARGCGAGSDFAGGDGTAALELPLLA